MKLCSEQLHTIYMGQFTNNVGCWGKGEREQFIFDVIMDGVM